MAKFDDIRAAYHKFHRDHIRYYRLCQSYIVEFTNDFRSYIGAPNGFTDHERGMIIPYISVMESRKTNDGSIEYFIFEPTRILPDIVKSEDGQWLSAIRYVVDMGENIHPKRAYDFKMKFLILNNQCFMNVGENPDGNFSFDITVADEKARVFDFMTNWLERNFARVPWETEVKSTIGFIGEDMLAALRGTEPTEAPSTNGH